MNRKRKLKQMRRFINRYGYIEHEYKRPPEKGFYPYRKGSFFASFYSNELGLMRCTKRFVATLDSF